MKKTKCTEEIIKKESSQKECYISEQGNVFYRYGSNKVHLALRTETKLTKLTKDYYYIEPIYGEGLEELYVVCDVVSSQLIDHEEEFDNSKLAFKYGIVALQRDEDGNIIPMGEKIVVPIIYDEISENNLKTVTAQANDHLTYIDIDSNSKNYGEQIVPAVLEHACPFSVDYEGFAECSVDGVIGYLPRDCQPRTTLNPLSLLTEEQVKYLSPYLYVGDEALHESSWNKYSELIGSAKILRFPKKKQ